MDTFKVIVIGEVGIGKTSIATRFAQNEFSEDTSATITPKNYDQLIKINVDNDANEKTVKLNIWDTEGQEKFNSLNWVYYRNSKGVLLVYDETNNESFLKLKTWL